MKNIVIAAGYATRLGELTRNFPKPLLQIGESTILGRMLDENNRVLNMEENGCGNDAPGNLAHYMVDNTVMHAWPMSAGRFDIGSLDIYEEAKKLFG